MNDSFDGPTRRAPFLTGGKYHPGQMGHSSVTGTGYGEGRTETVFRVVLKGVQAPAKLPRISSGARSRLPFTLLMGAGELGVAVLTEEEWQALIG